MIRHLRNFVIYCIASYHDPTGRSAVIKDGKDCFCLKVYPVLGLIIKWAIKTAYIKVYFHAINSIKCLLELQGIPMSMR